MHSKYITLLKSFSCIYPELIFKEWNYIKGATPYMVMTHAVIAYP